MAKPMRVRWGQRSSGVAFRPAYAEAFHAFLRDQSETALRAAYELGRGAVAQQVGLLELAQAHHLALLAALSNTSETASPEKITRAASDFLLEALSAYEMVRRAVTEAQETVQSERRQAEMVRQLSSLLADTSLALQTSSSIEEMLQLVAEQTHELILSSWCIAHAYVALPRPTVIYAFAGREPTDPDHVIEESYAAFGSRTEASAFAVDIASSANHVIAVPLAALNGETIGVLALGNDERPRLSELEDALFIHIGQMTAAALERAMRYHVALP
jgi:GAF domain-containing protein